ncbi:MAG: PVC-type heme-binding CxxCH protein [Pirellulales bacterium]
MVLAKAWYGAALLWLVAAGPWVRETAAVELVKFPEAQPQRELRSGMPPAEAASYMSVPEGFRIQLVAGEPLVHQPVAMAIDARGRIWIAEAYTYPNRAPEGEGRDKIVILEDTDGDGEFETRRVFAEGLNLISGLEVGFGGVWVGAAPYFMFIPDADGDDQPDSAPQILLDGFGYHDTHETLNAFIWGPDGWLYGCHGVFTHSLVGKPGTPDADRTPLNAGVWRYHPVRHEFEVFAWGTSNPWGVDFNDQGHAFITACVIPHLWHVIQGGRYQRQGGQHFDPYVFQDLATIARHRHYSGDIADHAWWGKEPVTPADTLAAGGGHAHCGAMIYLGDNWPSEYRNDIYMHNIHGNRMNHDRLIRAGSGYAGDRAPDVMLANDRWFRGIGLKYGPDGSVYFFDWYDPNACHRTNPEIWDRTNGRVYNLSYGDVKRVRVNLDQMSDEELASLQTHTNDWYVRTSRRILEHRHATGKLNRPSVQKLLQSQLSGGGTVPQRLRALWALHAIGGASDEVLGKLLSDSDENLRSWAIQLQLEDRQISEPALRQLVELAKSDPSPVVRLYLSSALQRIPVADRWDLAAALLRHAEDAEDQNLPLMIWYGVEPLVGADVNRALALGAASKLDAVGRFIVRRAAAEPATREAVFERLAAATDPAEQKMLVEEISRAFEGQANLAQPQAWAKAYPRLMASGDAEVQQHAEQIAVLMGDRRIFPRLRQQVLNAQLPLKARQDALEILIRGRDTDAAETFQQLLSDGELRGAALRALSQLEDERTPDAVLKVYSQLSPAEKSDAVSALASRVAYARRLVQAMVAGTVPRTDVHAYHVRQIVSLQDADLERQIREVWGEIRESNEAKQQRMAELKGELSPERLQAARISHGRMLFDQTCGKCHRLFGEGGEVGPDITGSNRTNLDYLLQNVVDPSAVLGKDYRMSVLELNDGRVVSGLIQRETPSALTVRTLNDTVVIAKSEIENQKLSELSMMPEGLLDPMTKDQIRDLVGYLQSPTQVAPSGPAAPIDASTGRVAGAIEAESMKVVGKSTGNVGTQPMGSFPLDRWSDGSQLWWTGGRPGDSLDLEIPVEQAGKYALHVVLTRAPDYGTVQLLWDDQPLGQPVDLYDPGVVTTGELIFPPADIAAGAHRLTIKITGQHPAALGQHMFGLDYVRLVPASE